MGLDIDARVYSDYIKMTGIDSYLVNKASVKKIDSDSIELELVHYKKDDRITDTIRVSISDDNATVVHDKKKVPITDPYENIIYNISRETEVTEFGLKDETLTITNGKLTQTIRQNSLEAPSQKLDDINSILGLNCMLVDIFNHRRSPITKETYTAEGLKSLKDGLGNIEICPKSVQKIKK